MAIRILKTIKSGNLVQAFTDIGCVLISKANRPGHVQVDHVVNEVPLKADHLLGDDSIASIAKKICEQHGELFIRPHNSAALQSTRRT